MDDRHFFEWNWGKLSLAWGIFFFWGVWCRENWSFVEKLQAKYLVPLGLAALLAMLPYYLELQAQQEGIGAIIRDYFVLSGLVYQFLMCTFMIALVARLEQSGAVWAQLRPLAKYGKETYGLYLVHILFLLLAMQLWRAAGLPDTLWLKFPALAVVNWASSLYFLRLCRLPGLGVLNRLLFGGRS